MQDKAWPILDYIKNNLNDEKIFIIIKHHATSVSRRWNFSGLRIWLNIFQDLCEFQWIVLVVLGFN